MENGYDYQGLPHAKTIKDSEGLSQKQLKNKENIQKWSKCRGVSRLSIQ